MVSEAFAKKQIFRLSRLRNFPSQPDEAPLRADLVHALMECASDDQAMAIVEDWLGESEDAPSIAQLRATVRVKASTKEIGCEACKFTGFLLAEVGGYLQATPCQCHPARREKFAHA